METRILCVEDDLIMQTLIGGSLHGFSLIFASTLQQAEQELRSKKFDALILDILLPDGDGLKFWTKLSTETNFSSIPVLFLTGQNEISNKIEAFSLGADDFITKPFDPQELRARLSLRIKTKSSKKPIESIRRLGNLEVDLDRQSVTLHTQVGAAQDLALTAIELKLLILLSKNFEHIYSRQEILQQVWGSSHVSDRTVDSHIAHLRAKISDSTIEIQTVKNSGYRLTKKTSS